MLQRERGVLEGAKLEGVGLRLGDGRWGGWRRRIELRAEAVALQQLFVELDVFLATEALRARHVGQREEDEDRGRDQGLVHTAPHLSGISMTGPVSIFALNI